MRQVIAFIVEMSCVVTATLLLCIGVLYLAYLIFMIAGMLTHGQPTP